MLRLNINGQAHESLEGTTILDALHALKIEIPTLCHDPRLKPYGACRLCVVEVHGASRPVSACNTPATDGMVINSHSPAIEKERRTLLKLLAKHYPKEAYAQAPDKIFHRYLREYGLEQELHGQRSAVLLDDQHPYINVDMSQCVSCFRCVRICEELQGQFVWKIWNRGDAISIRPDGPSLLDSPCVSCGACVDTCPSGALEDKVRLVAAPPTKWTRTTCAYCGTGCELKVGTSVDRAVAIEPVPDAPVSKGHLCVKGRYAFDYVHADDRITEPLIRENGQWRPASWPEAISYCAAKLSAILKDHGPDAIGTLGSSRATNEENYLAQKFARLVLGSNNIDCCARVCHTPTAAAMKMMLGTGAATNSYNDIELAHTILICGANPTENHPIIGARIRQAVLKGAKLIVIDPRAIELAQYADLHLALRPGTNIPLFNALAHVIVSEELYDKTFVEQRVAEWPEYRAFIEQWTPERVAPICGVSADLIRQAARLYAVAKPTMSIHGLGMTEHVQGTEGVMAVVNLSLLTGNIGIPGAGVNPLRGQNNVQGAAQMGCDPGILTGSIALKSGKDSFEKVWGATLPTKVGLNLMDMVDAAGEGKLKALYAIGYDLLLTNANKHTTNMALQQLDFVIIQDMFLSETAQAVGSVFLPVASSFEKDGTFMNAERRIQRVRQALPPWGHSKSDWDIICLLAQEMGHGQFFPFKSAEEIWNEVRRVWPAAQGISYSRMEQGGLQWPCPSEDHPGTTILHEQAFASSATAALRRLNYHPTPEITSESYPFLLNTGRALYHFNSSTMTGRTANKILRPSDLLDISPHDAAQLKINNGDSIRVTSQYGQAILPGHINSAIKNGELFGTFHSPEIALNNVTSPQRDRYVKTPEYKVTAVKIEKL